jgi:5-methylcytosine-specific restriction endonuclease McrA
MNHGIMILEKNIENEISEFFKINEHSLCDIFVLKSIFDVSNYSTKNSKGRWNGVAQIEDGFEIDLDFVASSVGYYYWRPSFYFGLTILPHIKNIDLTIYDILKGFKEKYKKNRGALPPKRTFLCSKSTKDYREKIKNEIQKQNIIINLDKKLTCFEILNDGKITIKKDTVNQNKKPLNEKLDKIFSNYFSKSNSLLSEITIEKPPRSSPLPKSVFDKIKKTQNHCFYCNDTRFNVQEHVLPEQIMRKTIPYNIVASCEKCNRRKWDYLLPYNIFEQVLIRNKKFQDDDIFKVEYDPKDFKETYEGFRELGIPVIDDLC